MAGGILSAASISLPVFGNWTVILSAITGAAGVLLIILLISVSIRDNMTLLIIGLMVGSLSAALVSIMQYYGEAEQIQSFLIWTFGNLGGVHGQELQVLATAVTIGLLGAFFINKPLNALLLGESYAISMGVKVKMTRILIVILTSVLAGGITAFCGPLAFIGIAIPHLARILFKTSNHRVLDACLYTFGSHRTDHMRYGISTTRQ